MQHKTLTLLLAICAASLAAPVPVSNRNRVTERVRDVAFSMLDNVWELIDIDADDGNIDDLDDLWHPFPGLRHELTDTDYDSQKPMLSFLESEDIDDFPFSAWLEPFESEYFDNFDIDGNQRWRSQRREGEKKHDLLS